MCTAAPWFRPVPGSTPSHARTGACSPGTGVRPGAECVLWPAPPSHDRATRMLLSRTLWVPGRMATCQLAAMSCVSSLLPTPWCASRQRRLSPFRAPARVPTPRRWRWPLLCPPSCAPVPSPHRHRVRLHSEVPLIALLGPVHLGVTFAAVVLGQTWCCNWRGINQRAALEQKPLDRQRGVDGGQDLQVQVEGFEQVTWTGGMPSAGWRSRRGGCLPRHQSPRTRGTAPRRCCFIVGQLRQGCADPSLALNCQAFPKNATVSQLLLVTWFKNTRGPQILE